MLLYTDQKFSGKTGDHYFNTALFPIKDCAQTLDMKVKSNAPLPLVHAPETSLCFQMNWEAVETQEYHLLKLWDTPNASLEELSTPAIFVFCSKIPLQSLNHSFEEKRPSLINCPSSSYKCLISAWRGC